MGSSPSVALTLFESSSALGGHANTVDVKGRPVDTGFLVYNEETYPNLCGLFAELGVPTEPSDMSFGVSLAARTFEWSSNGLGGLFAQPLNAFSPSFRAMLSDISRFNAEAPKLVERARAEGPGGAAERVTMREFLDDGKYSGSFRASYLIPQVAAVWSAAAADVLDFPALTLIQFMMNHSLCVGITSVSLRYSSRNPNSRPHPKYHPLLYVHSPAAPLSPQTSSPPQPSSCRPPAMAHCLSALA